MGGRLPRRSASSPSSGSRCSASCSACSAAMHGYFEGRRSWMVACGALAAVALAARARRGARQARAASAAAARRGRWWAHEARCGAWAAVGRPRCSSRMSVPPAVGVKRRSTRLVSGPNGPPPSWPQPKARCGRRLDRVVGAGGDVAAEVDAEAAAPARRRPRPGRARPPGRPSWPPRRRRARAGRRRAARARGPGGPSDGRAARRRRRRRGGARLVARQVGAELGDRRARLGERGRRRRGRCCAPARCASRPGRRRLRTARCWEIAGRETSKFRASSPTGRPPSASSTRRIARRRGSSTAAGARHASSRAMVSGGDAVAQDRARQVTHRRRAERQPEPTAD